MRQILTLACAAFALSALGHASASAQDADETESEFEEEVLETDEEPVEEATVLTYILSAPDRFLAEYGGAEWLDAGTEICLEEGEVVELARPSARIAAMELRGALCTSVADAPQAATVLVEAQSRPPRVRSGAVRGTASVTSRRTVGYRVASGSEAVLAQHPRGSRVTSESEICLERGQQVTLISSAGQRVTYRGPGCARRNAAPSARNIGGFTFGWNGHALTRHTVRLP